MNHENSVSVSVRRNYNLTFSLTNYSVTPKIVIRSELLDYLY